MDDHRFDFFAKTLAGGASRRSVLRRLVAGSATVGLLGVAGPRPARARETTPAAGGAGNSVIGKDGQCAMFFEVAVRSGPSAGWSASGILAAAVDAEGRVDGAFVQGNGKTVRVAGQATGRAVNLLFDLGDGRVLYRVGTTDGDLRTCQVGNMGGPVVGPQPGDFGDWAVVQRTPPSGSICLLGAVNCPPLPAPSDQCDRSTYDNCIETCEAMNVGAVTMRDCPTFCPQVMVCKN